MGSSSTQLFCVCQILKYEIMLRDCFYIFVSEEKVIVVIELHFKSYQFELSTLNTLPQQSSVPQLASIHLETEYNQAVLPPFQRKRVGWTTVFQKYEYVIR